MALFQIQSLTEILGFPLAVHFFCAEGGTQMEFSVAEAVWVQINEQRYTWLAVGSWLRTQPGSVTVLLFKETSPGRTVWLKPEKVNYAVIRSTHFMVM